MTAAVALWAHALAALLFAAGAGAAWRQGPGGRALAAALIASALWSLAMAGIDARDLSTRLAEAGRNLAWLGFAVVLARRADGRARAFAAVTAVVAGVVVVAAALAVAEAVATGVQAQAALAAARLAFRMMAAAGALIMARQLYVAAPAAGGTRLLAIALGGLWAGDLVVFAAVWAAGGWSPLLGLARGMVAVVVAALLLAAAQRRDTGTLALSRPATLRMLGLAALAGYGGLAAGLARLAGAAGGDHARLIEAGVAVGAATALLTFVSSSWFGAWTRVKLAKHLFRHRYDYRAEWQRFTDGLGEADGTLEERVARALAQPLDAPAALLLTTDGAGAAWRWEAAPAPLDAGLADYLATSRRILELDALSPAEAALLPGWLTARAEAWALVPLVHGDVLAGAVLLARPPVARRLDWEDFDLLRVAGRQAAAALAEDRAGRALAEAGRFDEFNRRFAFILHDMKNLASQQQLVARNAERHADNPAFRADMVATLRESAERMATLLARLSQAEPPASEPLTAVDAGALVARLARSGGHVVEAAPCWAAAHAGRLEQLLRHLVQNAVEAGGPVTLHARHDGARVTIEVEDRGTGMSAAFVRDELFRPFSSTKPGGFGIGAYQARAWVRAMGGTLTVDSREGAGTRFTVALPAAPALEIAA